MVVAANVALESGREHLLEAVRLDFPDTSILVNAAGVMRASRLAPGFIARRLNSAVGA